MSPYQWGFRAFLMKTTAISKISCEKLHCKVNVIICLFTIIMNAVILPHIFFFCTISNAR